MSEPTQTAVTYLTVTEAAALSGYCVASIRTMCRRGLIRCERPYEGAQWRIPSDFQDDWKQPKETREEALLRTRATRLAENERRKAAARKLRAVT